MNTTQSPRLQELLARWNRWDAQLRGIGAHARRATRRWLVTLYLVCVAADCAAALLFRSMWGLVLWVSLGVAGVLLGVIRNATRNAADTPDHALDEMLTRIRNSYRARAYRILAPLCMAACIVLSIPGDPLFSSLLGITLSDDIVEAVAWPLFLIAMGLPTLIAGWTVPDVDDPAE